MHRHASIRGLVRELVQHRPWTWRTCKPARRWPVTVNGEYSWRLVWASDAPAIAPSATTASATERKVRPPRARRPDMPLLRIQVGAATSFALRAYEPWRNTGLRPAWVEEVAGASGRVDREAP